MYKGIKSEKFLPFQWHKSALKFQIILGDLRNH